jgi:hypothetical protein
MRPNTTMNLSKLSIGKHDSSNCSSAAWTVIRTPDEYLRCVDGPHAAAKQLLT